MLPLHRNRFALAATTGFFALLVLSGCDSVALEGKVFDWMGVSGSAMDQNRRDPKMADRAPLVVPPNVARLPQPGSGQTATDDVASLRDPELVKEAKAKERERLHLAYCRGELQWKERALDPNSKANRSPYGPCPSLFGIGSAIDNNVNK
jgi:hypothetical protein